MKIEDMPMVRLTWLDAQDSDGSWTDIEDIIAHKPCPCQEVGWLVHKDNNKVIVMRSRIVTEDDNVKEGGGHIAIPASWVIKIEELQINEENNISVFTPYSSKNRS